MFIDLRLLIIILEAAIAVLIIAEEAQVHLPIMEVIAAAVAEAQILEVFLDQVEVALEAPVLLEVVAAAVVEEDNHQQAI